MAKIFSTKEIASDLVQKARAEGCIISSLNFIEIQTIEEKKTVERIQALAQQKEIALFTSANAVKSVFKQINRNPNWEYFCIGGKTRDTLCQFVPSPTILGDASNGKALAEKIVSRAGALDKVIFFSGNKRMLDIPQTLAAHQIPLEEITVYRTVQTPQIVNANFDGILFFSPSGVESFFSQNQIPKNIPLFTIGYTTEKKIKEIVGNEVVVAPFPKVEQVIDQVIKYFHQ